MKDININRLTVIATVLRAIPNGNVVNGETGVALVYAERMHELGNALIEIITDEIEPETKHDV